MLNTASRHPLRTVIGLRVAQVGPKPTWVATPQEVTKLLAVCHWLCQCSLRSRPNKQQLRARLPLPVTRVISSNSFDAGRAISTNGVAPALCQLKPCWITPMQLTFTHEMTATSPLVVDSLHSRPKRPASPFRQFFHLDSATILIRS